MDTTIDIPETPARLRWKPVILGFGVLTIVIVALLGWQLLRSRPRDIRKFDAVEIAQLETEMWKAYYAKDQLNLYWGLTRMLREQYGFSILKANSVAWQATRAAFVFKKGRSRSDYDLALPYLRSFYEAIRDASKESFDTDAAAKLELEWWIIHRQRETYTREDLDKALARLPAELYKVPAGDLMEHAHLRAEAMLVRDYDSENGGVSEAEWNRINGLLKASWTALSVVVKPR